MLRVMHHSIEASCSVHSDALLVSALTGARPCEVVKGITTWPQHDEALPSFKDTHHETHS